jgi:hypothetical protein
MNAMILFLTATCVVGQSTAPTTSKDKVKITMKAEKPAEGKRVVALTLEIAKGWHMLANPVSNDDLKGEETRVSFTSGGKPALATIEYPKATRVVRDPYLGDFGVYEGTITIKAAVAQADDLQAAVWVRTLNGRVCILPSKVQLKVE